MTSTDAIKLFETFERTNNKPADHAEKQFKFLNRSARNRDARIRDLLELWFAEYPASDQHELKRRFESVKSQSYESAFFELSIHAILKRLGCESTPHPEMSGTTKRPEFLVTEPNASTFILEARLAGGESAAEVAANNLRSTIYDVLNRRIKTNDFFVNVIIRGTPERQPSSKELAEFVQGHLDTEDADAIIACGVSSMPSWTLRVDDKCTIDFRPVPRKPAVRGTPPDRPVGMIVTEAKWGDDVTPILDAVLEKSNRYGRQGQPYIVAVNSMAFDLEQDDIVQAITGLWQHERIRQVSGILLASWLMPISVAHAAISLYFNPAAEWPYSGVLTALSQGFTENGIIRMVEGRTLADIFGVPIDWPRLGSDN
jgi:hypothetical protein